MDRRQNLVLFLLALLLAGIAAWLEFGLLGDPGPGSSSSSSGERGVAASPTVEPDYYIENFTSTGLDRAGKKYRVIADRLAHYPLDDRALLERPHIIQYDPAGGATRHIHADSGWLYDDDDEVSLSGNVRVIEKPGGGDGGGAVVTSEKMLIRLKGGRG